MADVVPDGDGAPPIQAQHKDADPDFNRAHQTSFKQLRGSRFLRCYNLLKEPHNPLNVLYFRCCLRRCGA